MLQIIQTLTLSDDFSIVNNTFYDYVNRYNQTMDYYADTAKGSYTFENKTDFKVKFPSGPVRNEIDAGFTYRYAHVLDIQNYNNEPVSVFDLSKSPNTWVFPTSAQIIGGAFPYTGGLRPHHSTVSPVKARPSARFCIRTPPSIPTSRTPRSSSSTA